MYENNYKKKKEYYRKKNDTLWDTTKEQCRRAKKHAMTSKFEKRWQSASTRERQHGAENLVISPALTRYSLLAKDNYAIIFQDSANWGKMFHMNTTCFMNEFPFTICIITIK